MITMSDFTNKQSVIEQLIKEQQQEELDKLYKQTSSLEFRINQLNNLN